jgi:hypothetical protein
MTTTSEPNNHYRDDVTLAALKRRWLEIAGLPPDASEFIQIHVNVPYYAKVETLGDLRREWSALLPKGAIKLQPKNEPQQQATKGLILINAVELVQQGWHSSLPSAEEIRKLRKGDLVLVVAADYDVMGLGIDSRDGDIFFAWHEGELVAFHACNILVAIWPKRESKKGNNDNDE